MTHERWASFAELDGATLYDLLRLRAEVFVVEQACAYLDLDGRDAEPGARHGWLEDGGRAVTYLRVLDDVEGVRVGRVATAATHRGQGLAGQLVRAALARAAGPVVLDAQAHLVAWYEGFGFTVAGPGFLEDGIPHVPMRLDRA